jgi:outer membrane lipoprotein SlyB
MCLQANISLLAFIPGAFIGAAIYFGSGDVVTAVVGLVSGGLFGYVSEKGSNLLMGKKSEEASE